MYIEHNFNVSINILQLNTQFPIVGVGPRPFDRINEIAYLSKDYDVLLFQEVFRWCFFYYTFSYGYGGILLTYLHKNGFFYTYTSPNPSWGQNSGLLIASKYPIISKKNMTFKNWGGIESWTSKGLIDVKIAFPVDNYPHNNIYNEKYIRFIVTHLQASGEKYRNKQIKEIHKYIRKNGYENDIIIAGDFNLDSNDREEYNYMKDTLTNIYDYYDGYDGYDDLNTIVDNNRERLDYIVIHNKKYYKFIKCKILSEYNYISDHLPQECKLNINNLNYKTYLHNISDLPNV